MGANVPNFPEVEAKIIDVDPVRDGNRLIELGAERVSEKELTAVWMEGHGRKFRVRKEGDDVKVEIKTPISAGDGVKACSETGFASIDFHDTLRFFETLGFSQTSRSVKERVAYLLSLDCWSEAEVVFDTYSDLEGMAIPPLMEIEIVSVPDSELPNAISDSGNHSELIARLRAKIAKVAESLGYGEADLKDWSAHDLAEHYRALESAE